MSIDIKHKHASHVIIIEGHAFKANDQGQWNLTDIWRTLKLPKGNAPAQWRTKQALRWKLCRICTAPMALALGHKTSNHRVRWLGLR